MKIDRSCSDPRFADDVVDRGFLVAPSRRKPFDSIEIRFAHRSLNFGCRHQRDR
jgi:hypothetical protein